MVIRGKLSHEALSYWKLPVDSAAFASSRVKPPSTSRTHTGIVHVMKRGWNLTTSEARESRNIERNQYRQQDCYFSFKPLSPAHTIIPTLFLETPNWVQLSTHPQDIHSQLAEAKTQWNRRFDTAVDNRLTRAFCSGSVGARVSIRAAPYFLTIVARQSRSFILACISSSNASIAQCIL